MRTFRAQNRRAKDCSHAGHWPSKNHASASRWVAPGKAGEVRGIDALRFDQHEMSDAKSCQILHEEGTHPADSDDTDLGAFQNGLAGITEDSRLTVEGRCYGGGRLPWLRQEHGASSTHHDGAINRQSQTAGPPDIPCDCALGENQCADGLPIGEIEQCRIAALMAIEVISGKGDAIRAPVVVDVQVDELVVSALEDAITYIGCAEHPVATISRNEVYAILSEVHRTRQETHMAVGTACEASGDDGSVFIMITWEEVTMEPVVKTLGEKENQLAGVRVQRDSTHRCTFTILIRGVSRSELGSRWFDRRETCTA